MHRTHFGGCGCRYFNERNNLLPPGLLATRQYQLSGKMTPVANGIRAEC